MAERSARPTANASEDRGFVASHSAINPTRPRPGLYDEVWFAQGVDDVMTVPFAPEELLAHALVRPRRFHGESHSLQATVQFGEIKIDILNRQVSAGTSVIHLTGLGQRLLYVLVANAGQVVTRDEILDALWGVDFVVESNVVDRHIRALRIKLQDDWRRPRFIATVPGRGCRFLPTFSSAVEARRG